MKSSRCNGKGDSYESDLPLSSSTCVFVLHRFLEIQWIFPCRNFDLRSRMSGIKFGNMQTHMRSIPGESFGGYGQAHSELGEL